MRRTAMICDKFVRVFGLQEFQKFTFLLCLYQFCSVYFQNENIFLLKSEKQPKIIAKRVRFKTQDVRHQSSCAHWPPKHYICTATTDAIIFLDCRPVYRLSRGHALLTPQVGLGATLFPRQECVPRLSPEFTPMLKCL